MLENPLRNKLRLSLNQFTFRYHGNEHVGYWATLTEEFSMNAVVEENWRSAHEYGTRLFVGSSSIRDHFGHLSSQMPESVIYVLPGFPVIGICDLANCGDAYSESVNFKDRLRQVLLEIFQSWPFEILEADEIVLTVQLLQRPNRYDANKIEELIMGIAPFSGDIGEKPRIRDAIRRNCRFNVRMSVE